MADSNLKHDVSFDHENLDIELVTLTWLDGCYMAAVKYTVKFSLLFVNHTQCY